MKTHPFSYLKKAPRLPGLRRLKPDEIGREGDFYGFLSVFRFTYRARKGPPVAACPLDTYGCLRVGRSLRESREVWATGCNARSFDGILYRPTR